MFIFKLIFKVVHYGMSEKVGNVSFDMPQPGEMTFDKPYSEQTAQLIDEEVRKLIESAFNRTFKLLTENKTQIEKVRKNIKTLFILRYFFLKNSLKDSFTFTRKRGFK